MVDRQVHSKLKSRRAHGRLDAIVLVTCAVLSTVFNTGFTRNVGVLLLALIASSIALNTALFMLMPYYDPEVNKVVGVALGGFAWMCVTTAIAIARDVPEVRHRHCWSP
jgi:hypothetical protein